MARSKAESAVLKSFGANVRRLRVQAGFTQAKLAELVDVELRTEQKWESGEINPPFTTLVRVQGVFGCKWDELIGRFQRSNKAAFFCRFPGASNFPGIARHLVICDSSPVKRLEPPDTHRLAAADGWLGLGNWQEAQAEFEKITLDSRGHPHVLELRWQIYAKAEDWEEAIEAAREMTRQAPDSPFGWIHLAYSLHELRRTQEAYGSLKPILERFPDDWLVPYNMACYACQLGNLLEARHWLELACERGDRNEIVQMVRIDPDLEALWSEFGKI